MGRRLGWIAASALIATLLVSSAADARGLKTGFLDDFMFASPSAATRNAWLGRAAADRADMVRINVPWASVVGSSPPANPTNPADPAYRMGLIDAAVESARAKGLGVLLTAYLAPAWAEGPNRRASARAGTWKPNPKALGKFGQMLARRYSGNYRGLPKVNEFEAWNEPNLSTYLTPQWTGKKVFSPGHYRKMLNEFYEGVKRAQPKAKVIGGATAPFGDDRGHPLDPTSPRMRPLVFLKKLFCLKGKNKPRKCPTKPHLDVLSHHPVNIVLPPTRSAKDSDDVLVADFGKLRKLLRAAERARNIKPKGHHGLWATEIWWFSKPPNRIGIPVQKEARWLEQGLYLLWKQGASVAVNYLIRDLAYDPNEEPQAQWTTGVFFHDGTRKPAYQAFRFPFVGDRKSKKNVGIWGKAPDSGKLKVQKQKGKRWKTVKKLEVRRGKLYKSTLRLKGKADLRGKLSDETSLIWHQR